MLLNLLPSCLLQDLAPGSLCVALSPLPSPPSLGMCPTVLPAPISRDRGPGWTTPHAALHAHEHSAHGPPARPTLLPHCPPCYLGGLGLFHCTTIQRFFIKILSSCKRMFIKCPSNVQSQDLRSIPLSRGCYVFYFLYPLSLQPGLACCRLIFWLVGPTFLGYFVMILPVDSFLRPLSMYGKTPRLGLKAVLRFLLPGVWGALPTWASHRL